MSVKVGRKLAWAQNSIETVYVHNKRGSALAPGDVVILDATDSTATEIAVDVTSTIDDKAVFGMAIENIGINGYGEVQTKGPTAILKANGTTTAIAVGDYLSTYAAETRAGFATSGKGAVFAIALENLSSGTATIDAYLMGGVGRFDTSSQAATYSNATLTGTLTVSATTGFTSASVVTLAGSASLTDVLILTAGDLTMSAGHFNIADVGTTDVITISHATGIMAADEAALKILDSGAIASGGNMLRIEPTGSPDAASILFEIDADGLTGQAIYVDGDPTDIDLVHFYSGGAIENSYAVLGISNDAVLAAGGALLNLTCSGSPNSDARMFEIDDGNQDCIAMYISSGAATVSAVQILGAGNVNDGEAMLHVTNTGTVASGGALVRIESGATGTSGSYGLIIDCADTTIEGLWVENGTSLFEDDVKIGVDSNSKLMFRDTGVYIYSNANGTLDFITDGDGVLFGANGTGTDVKLFGGTSSNYVLYDASDNELEIVNTTKQAFSIVSTLTGGSALNAVNWAIADATTQSTGYNAAFLFEVTKTGNSSPTEYSGARFNLMLNTDTQSGIYNALKAKVGTGDAPTITSAVVNGFFVSLDDIGTLARYTCVWLEIYGSSATESNFIECHSQGTNQVTNFLKHMGGKQPTYFLATQTSLGTIGFADGGGTAGDQCIGHIAMNFNGTTGYLNIYSDNS